LVQDITHFLKTTPQLDKTMIGDYIGENIEVNKAVLYALVDSISFKNVPFVDALRKLLSAFRLPGEG